MKEGVLEDFLFEVFEGVAVEDAFWVGNEDAHCLVGSSRVWNKIISKSCKCCEMIKSKIIGSFGHLQKRIGSKMEGTKVESKIADSFSINFGFS